MRTTNKNDAAQTSFEALLFPDPNVAQGGSARHFRETEAIYEHQIVPVYGIKLVRMDSVVLRDCPQVTRGRDVAAFFQKYLEGTDREHFVALLLDTRLRIIGVNTISIGNLTQALVHPREVFKPAILANAAQIILAHNHPSGDPEPSPEDGIVTKHLQKAGEMLGIPVVDHIVVGHAGRYISLKEAGLL